MRESFVFYKSFYESIKELDPNDQVKIYNAIFEYEFYQEAFSSQRHLREIRGGTYGKMSIFA